MEVLNLAGGESVAIADCDGICLVLAETTPLEPDALESTYYKPGVGVILEVDEETGARAELISFSAGGGPELSDAKLLIEHNATDEDTGFQGFGDGDPYNVLTITGPGDVLITTVTALGGCSILAWRSSSSKHRSRKTPKCPSMTCSIVSKRARISTASSWLMVGKICLLPLSLTTFPQVPS